MRCAYRHTHLIPESLAAPNTRAQWKPFLQRFELARDHHALDIAGAFINLADPHIAVNPLHWKILHLAVAAMDLDGVRADLFRHFGGE